MSLPEGLRLGVDSRPRFSVDRDNILPQADVINALNHRGYAIITGIPVAHARTDAVRLAVSKDLISNLSFLGTLLPQGADSIDAWFVRNEGVAKDSAQAQTLLGGKASKSPDRLGFHNDAGPQWHGYDIRTVGLLVFAQARSGGETKLVDARVAYDTLSQEDPEAARILRESPFYFSRKNGHEPDQLPYSSGHIIDPGPPFRVRHSPNYDQGFTLAGKEMQPEQVQAVSTWKAILARPELHEEFTLQPGELLLLNEMVTLHARTSFEDDPDNPRTLSRIWFGDRNAFN